MRIGHAMRRPVPGFLKEVELGSNKAPLSHENGALWSNKAPLIYANSDLSGFSIFEEAQYRGVTAAEHALKDIGRA